jgi:hypothetical protein
VRQVVDAGVIGDVRHVHHWEIHTALDGDRHALWLGA